MRYLGKTAEIQTNKIFEHLSFSNKKIIVEQGGTRSGKTYNILLWIIFHYAASNRNKTITICRKTFPALRASVMRDFIEILRSFEMYSEEMHNKSSSEYNLYGNLIEFISLDQPQKVRGRKRDLLFINEANELFWEDWQQLIFRTQGRIILDYNPSEEFHWIYEKVIPRDDVDFFKTTYMDNPFLDQTIVEEIERLRETDEQYWQIYGLGEKGFSKSTIFGYTEVQKIPENASFQSYGMDFGFTNDPTTLIGVWTEGYNMYLREYLFRTMMTTIDIHRELQALNIERDLIYADSAEVRLIEELRRMGWNIRKSIKGKDSINAGIDLLKRYKIHITSDSRNMIQEFRNYKWKEDRNGKILNIPIDSHNHTIDAARYSAYATLSKPNFGKYAIR